MTPNELLPEYEWSTEELVHYRCTVCGGWWTIGDGTTEHTLTCPYCSKKLTPAEYNETKTPSTPTRKSIDL